MHQHVQSTEENNLLYIQANWEVGAPATDKCNLQMDSETQRELKRMF